MGMPAYDLARRWTREEVLALPDDGNRPDEILQPDVFVAPAASGKLGATWADAGIPLLVIEVLSPRTARFDRVTKRLRYRRAGVPAYWIVDLGRFFAGVLDRE